MNDSLNGLRKTKGKKMQVDLSIRKDGVTSGNSLIISSYFSWGMGGETLLLFLCACL